MKEQITALQTGPFGVNTYIIPLADSYVLVVDPAACAFTRDADKITGWLRSHGRTPAGIFITHGHFDHITGIAELRKAYPQCPAAIHRDDACALGPGAAAAQAQALETMGLSKFLPALASVPEADVTFTGGETLDKVFGKTAGGRESPLQEDVLKALAQWRIIHTPGHSPGSVCLYSAERNELISGDTMFYRSYGRTDLGGDENAIIRSLVMLKDTIPGETLVYPGHDYYGFTFSEGI